MRAVDTNVLVRLLVQDDPRQTAAAKSFVTSGAWVSHLVLAEVVWVLDAVFSMQPASLAKSIRMLVEHESLVLQDADVVEAALNHFTDRPALGFTDCLVLEIARKAGHSPLGTSDRRLSKLPGAHKL